MDLMVISDDGAVHTARVFPCARRDAPILLCLPAMGAAAGYYTPFAQALASGGLGVAALLDLRGQGASSARARRDDFGYREILELDIPGAIARLPRSAVTRVEIEGVREHTPWKRHFSWARRPEEAVGAIRHWLRGSVARAAA